MVADPTEPSKEIRLESAPPVCDGLHKACTKYVDLYAFLLLKETFYFEKATTSAFDGCEFQGLHLLVAVALLRHQIVSLSS